MTETNLKTYFLAFEYDGGRHFYSRFQAANEKAAIRRAKIAYHVSGFNVTTMYLYTAYCTICAPDIVSDCDHEAEYIEPATHLDYLIKVDGIKTRNLSEI